MKDYRGTDRFISERIRKRVTVLLAFFVVLSTSYAMIRPGETLNRGPAEGFIFFEGESTAEPELINAEELIDEEMAKESAVPVETEEPQPAEETPLETELPAETIPADDTTGYITPEPTITPATTVEPVFTENPVIIAEETSEPEDTVLPEATETPEATEVAEEEESPDPEEEETPDPEETPEAKDTEATIIYNDWMSVKTADEKFGLQVKLQEDSLIPEDGTIELITLDEDYEDYSEYRDKAIEAVADEYDIDAEQLNVLDVFDLSFYDKEGTLVQPSNSSKVKVNFDQYTDEEKLHVVHFKGSIVKKEEQPLEEPVSFKRQLMKNNMSAGVQTKAANAETDNIEILEFESEEDGTVTFETESFSVYAVVEEGNEGDYARMNLHFMNGDTEVAMIIVKNGDTREELDHIIYDPGVGTIPQGTIFKGWSTEASYTVDDAENGMDIDDVRDWAAARTITENEDVYIYAMLYKNFVINYLDDNNVGVGSENVFMVSGDTSAPYTVNMGYTPGDDTHAFLGWNVAEGSSNIEGYTPGHLYKNGEEITISGNVTFSVNAPEGHWLVFDENGRGATYNAPVFLETTDVTQKPVADSAMTRFGYTFGGWYDTKEHADAHAANPSVTTGAFQFGNTINDRTTIYASWIPTTRAGYTIIIWKQNVNGDGYDFAETVTGTGNVGTNIPLGNTTNRNYTGFHLKETPAAVQIVPEGNAVVNVYYDRTEYTLRFQIYDYTYTATTSNNGTQYGIVNGEYVQLSRHGRNNNYYWTYNDGWISEGPRYTGTRYTRSSNQSWQTVKEIKALYEQNISNNFPIVGTNGVTYDNGERWDPQSNNQGWNEVMVLIESMPAESINFHLDVATRPLKTMNYYVEALPTDTENIVTRNGTRYVLYKSIGARYNGVTAEDFVELDGFTKVAAAATVNGQALTPHSVSGLNGQYYIASTSQDQTIYFFYSRDSYVINYMDGVYVDGNGNTIDEPKTATWGTSESIQYQADISSYNKGGANYYEPTKAGYVFEGWYIDDACTQPYTFTSMPKGGVTVYAKWRQIQYRVFLHPNADHIPDLDWGSATQQLNFRVSLGGTVSTPTGRSQEWEFVGWYTDPSCSASSLFSSDTVLNENTVTAAYDKTKDFTEPMDKWGNGATTNGDLDRFWITKKFDLYAKWRAKLIGANGIGVVYNAGEGTNAPSDSNLYLDQAHASAQPASTAPAGKQFVRWVVQKWNNTSNRYEDTNVYVYPGDTFEVLKNNAKYVVTQTDPVTDEVIKATYTVQLRAEYVDTGTGVPTHINWYGNNETVLTAPSNFVVTQENVLINQAVDVKPANTFSYVGHTFLGWARVPTSDNNGNPLDPSLESKLSGNNLSLADLGVADLFLKYDAATGKYEATSVTVGATEGTTVSKVAPDERYPYHAMVAVWEVNTYKVTIKKLVEGITTDQNFEISYDFDNTELTDSSVTLQHNGSQVLKVDVPHGTTITVSETAEGYEKSIAAALTQGGKGDPPETAGDGTYKIIGDTTITVTNIRQKGTLEISKQIEPEGIADSQKFKISIKNKAGKYLQDIETVAFGDEVQRLDLSVDGKLTIENLPADTYTVNEDTEQTAIDGYRYDETTYTSDDGTVEVTAGETASFTVTNKYTKLVDVVVTKELVDDYAEADKSFTFTASLKENDTDVTKKYIGAVAEGETGYLFTLVPGEEKTVSKIFEKVPIGTELTVTETEDTDYITTVTVGTGVTEESNAGILNITEANNTITFKNTRKLFIVDFKKTAMDGTTQLSNSKFTLTKKKGSVYESYPEGDLTLGTSHLELVVGDYELTETRAPDGYVILSNKIHLHVSADGVVTVDRIEFADGTAIATLEPGITENSKGTVTIKNKPGQALPHTGGSGTLPYTLSGFVLILFAVMYSFRMRRRERRNE